ncbi:MAG: hypothetical protein OXI63_22065, partial [Candidatus Poribacteria bacterium]|nr:hypothetical protein [Candidatus Poribacteria bacterium]
MAFESHSVNIRLEIEGEDLTLDLPPRPSITPSESRDVPNLGVFNSAGVNIPVLNLNGKFDPAVSPNFFTEQSLPPNGRGAKVLLTMIRDTAEVFSFAGEVATVNQALGSSIATLVVRDLSLRLRQTVVEDFGVSVTRRITDFEGANRDYSEVNPVFYFPAWGVPISEGSVSVTVHESGGDVDLNVVDIVATSGVLSNQNVEIDYSKGLIRFEAAPTDGADTEITVTWKTDYRYQRPDALIRLLLDHAGIDDRIGIGDAKDARFGIEQALVRHPSERKFSTNGRPHLSQSGVVRWMLRDESGDTPVQYLIQDDRFVEYDEYQDEYTELSELPEESGLEGGVGAGHGDYLSGESFNVSITADQSGDISTDVENNRIYILYGNTLTVRTYTLDGSELSNESGQLNLSGQPGVFAPRRPAGLDIYNGNMYLGYSVGVMIVDPETLSYSSSFTIDLSSISIDGFAQSVAHISSISVTSDRIYLLLQTRRSADSASVRRHNYIAVFNHTGQMLTAESTALSISDIGRAFGIKVVDNLIYLLTFADSDTGIGYNSSLANNSIYIRATTKTGSRVTDRDFEAREATAQYKTATSGGSDNRPQFSAIDIHNNRLYLVLFDRPTRRYYNFVYVIGDMVDFGGFVPYQFDTDDFDTFYFLSANNVRGNALATSTLDKVKVHEYVKSTDTWRELLNAITGQPQLSEIHKLNGELTYLANNRKNFQVVRRNNKTLIFYRRVQAGSSGVAYHNVTDNTITNVYNESHSGAEDFGLPYSMDFALDIRSDGIYVYTFVVRHTLETDGDYNAGSLKVIRRRVEPSAAQSQIYVENFTNSSDEEDYPVSVSSVILADDRSKFYFVLDYHGEGERPGKAELCTIAKAGRGSRTVIKTYDNPQLTARSPLQHGTDYYFLEGGWVRAPRDDSDEPNDQHHYPNTGGRLIAIESDNSVTDYGQAWRSATIADSPDDDNEIYDGWGLHNAIISNLIADGRDNLHFVAGYGTPYNVNENLPFSSTLDPIPLFSNFQWLQWGQDLATKIERFPTDGVAAWELIQRLAQVMHWEVGFGPRRRKVDALQARVPAISDWSANASLFFRPRTIIPAKLRAAMGATSTPTSIELDYSGLPAEVSEFPAPPSGVAYKIIIDKELFSYTSVAPSPDGA